MAQKRRKFSPEFRDEAVKMVVVESRPIAEVAREIQVNEGTLGTWVSRYRQEHAGEEPPLNISERARLRELERRSRRLPVQMDEPEMEDDGHSRAHRSGGEQPQRLPGVPERVAAAHDELPRAWETWSRPL